MKLEIRIAASDKSNEQHITASPKNIFHVIRLYYKAKKYKATAFLLWF